MDARRRARRVRCRRRTRTPSPKNIPGRPPCVRDSVSKPAGRHAIGRCALPAEENKASGGLGEVPNGLNAPGDRRRRTARPNEEGECQKGGGRAGDSRAARARGLSIELDTTTATRPPAPAGGICTRHLHRRRRAPPEFVGRHARCPFPIVSSCAPPSPSVSRGNNYTTTAASADDSKLTSSDS